jgi:hypothetical protein
MQCPIKSGIKFRRGDTSAEHPGLVFMQYARGAYELWTMPETLEKLRANSRAFHRSERGKLLAKQSTWNERNRERIREAKKSWNKRNPEKLKQYDRTKYLRNPKAAYARQKRYYARNINARLSRLLRCRIKAAIRLQDGSRATHSMDLIGCSIAHFRQHLESQFLPGMSWENYGKAWHIEHRVPCSAFNLADPEQQKLAFSYHNCQPLWKEQNLAKSDKIEGELFRGRELRKIVQFRAA